MTSSTSLGLHLQRMDSSNQTAARAGVHSLSHPGSFQSDDKLNKATSKLKGSINEIIDGPSHTNSSNSSQSSASTSGSSSSNSPSKLSASANGACASSTDRVSNTSSTSASARPAGAGANAHPLAVSSSQNAEDMVPTISGQRTGSTQNPLYSDIHFSQSTQGSTAGSLTSYGVSDGTSIARTDSDRELGRNLPQAQASHRNRFSRGNVGASSHDTVDQMSLHQGMRDTRQVSVSTLMNGNGVHVSLPGSRIRRAGAHTPGRSVGRNAVGRNAVGRSPYQGNVGRNVQVTPVRRNRWGESGKDKVEDIDTDSNVKSDGNLKTQEKDDVDTKSTHDNAKVESNTNTNNGTGKVIGQLSQMQLGKDVQTYKDDGSVKPRAQSPTIDRSTVEQEHHEKIVRERLKQQELERQSIAEAVERKRQIKDGQVLKDNQVDQQHVPSYGQTSDANPQSSHSVNPSTILRSYARDERMKNSFRPLRIRRNSSRLGGQPMTITQSLASDHQVSTRGMSQAARNSVLPVSSSLPVARGMDSFQSGRPPFRDASDANLKQINGQQRPMYTPAVLRSTTNLTDLNSAHPEAIQQRPIHPRLASSSSAASVGSTSSISSYWSYLCGDSDQKPYQEDAGPTRRHWRPNSSRFTCANCGRVFNYLTSSRRRHHCRHCGDLFCGDCLRNYIYLDGDAEFAIFGSVEASDDEVTEDDISDGERTKKYLCKVCPRCAAEYEQFVKDHTTRDHNLGPVTSTAHRDRRRSQAHRNTMGANAIPADWDWSSF